MADLLIDLSAAKLSGDLHLIAIAEVHRIAELRGWSKLAFHLRDWKTVFWLCAHSLSQSMK
jgi:hypothetical protein